MDVAYKTDEKKPGKFWQGFLISIGLWILDTGVVAVLYSVGTYSRHFRIYTALLLPMGVVLAVIWLPVAFIAGFRSQKKGLKDSLSLILISSFLAPIFVGCGFVMFFALVG
jgi:MFS-type transporter involved in bile tolerance (Atg22 family)